MSTVLFHKPAYILSTNFCDMYIDRHRYIINRVKKGYFYKNTECFEKTYKG